MSKEKTTSRVSTPYKLLCRVRTYNVVHRTVLIVVFKAVIRKSTIFFRTHCVKNYHSGRANSFDARLLNTHDRPQHVQTTIIHTRIDIITRKKSGGIERLLYRSERQCYNS